MYESFAAIQLNKEGEVDDYQHTTSDTLRNSTSKFFQITFKSLFTTLTLYEKQIIDSSEERLTEEQVDEILKIVSQYLIPQQ